MQVGTIVKNKLGILGNPIGTRGVVYETYDLGGGPGASVIFANGNYDGFSPVEQDKYLEEAGFSQVLSDYRFMNVARLSNDFDEGKFDPALNMPMEENFGSEHYERFKKFWASNKEPWAHPEAAYKGAISHGLFDVDEIKKARKQ